jgi:hypothetical protein
MMASRWERRLKQKEVLDMFELFRHSWPKLWVSSLLRCTMATCRNQEWDGDARKGQRGQREGGGQRQQIPTQPSPQKTCLNGYCDEAHLLSSNFTKIGAFGFAFLVMVKAEVGQSARARRNDQPGSRLVSRVPHKNGTPAEKCDGPKTRIC